ncbi:Serine/threonine-protein kinase PAK 1 [Melipona quadrifasciata]|uniref:non-specific serine/threonine protein kinase n=1 Tax=Melipona quadrifasciata TaxID=166423 RepID=A0A0M8ZYM1_9HYME|nr:Serine/threonine-protein kinase PAK 1 [Melipona quadrifasciata]
MSLNITKLFSRKKTGPVDTVAEIGLPTNVSHKFHVSKNAKTGQLEGLPESWIRFLNTQISKSEQDEHPAAALQAIKYYNYSIKRKPEEKVFKPFVTEDLIEEESQEIDKILSKKCHSEDFDGSSSASSTDSQLQRLPELPPKVNKTPKPTPRICSNRIEKTLTEILEDLNTYQIEDEDQLPENQNEQDKVEEESPILRRKTDCSTVKLNDEEIFEELQAICHDGDPNLRFEKIKEVGVGASGTVFIATDIQIGQKVAIKDIDLSKQPKKELILTEIKD